MYKVTCKIAVTHKYNFYYEVVTVAYIFNQNRDPIKPTDKCIKLVLPKFFLP